MAFATEPRWWETIRKDRGISCRLMVEAHWALADSDDILSLADEYGEDFHLLWDIVHTWNRSNRSALEDWLRLKPYIRHLHVKDAVRDPATKDGIRHTLPGQGELPLAELLEILRTEHFSGPVSLEWESFWNPEVPSLELALESGRIEGLW